MTLTAVNPRSKYGVLEVDKKTGAVKGFAQKGMLDSLINGGFMVCSKQVFSHVTTGSIEDMFPKLIKQGKLGVYIHKGFWKAMDTYQEMEELNKLWADGRPWAVWEKTTKRKK